MAAFKSNFLSVLFPLAVFFCLLQTSQAVCTVDLQLADVSYPEDICSFSLDCSDLTTESMDTKYGLQGITVVPSTVSRVKIMNGETFMVKAVLEPYLQGCYNYSKGTLTLYGEDSV